jgi:hypothetical protein
MFNSLIKTAPLNDGTQGFRFVVLGTISGFYRKRSTKNRYELTKGVATIGAHFGKRSIACNYRQSLRKFYRLCGA